MLVKYPIMDLSITRDCFAICGGGGSLKSGIRNTVDIYELSDTDPSGFEKTITADTGLELASGVAFSHDGQLIAVSVNASCWIYALDREAKTLTLLVKFRSDFADVESSQTSVCFVGNSTLLTGGEDGVVRVWRLTTEPSPKEKAKGTSKALDVSIPKEDAPKEKPGDKKTPPPSPDKPTLGDFAVQDSYMATLTREYRGHTKRIREIHVEPSHRNLVVSSSEDQSCHLWRLNEFTAICRFSKDDAVDVAYQQLKMKPLVGAKKHQFRCVRFANDGRALYTVLTPARGDTLLLKWTPSTRTQTRENEWLWVVEAAVVAGDRPVGSLCLSDDDRFVSTASVAGDVRVYEAATLQPYKKTSQFEHNFAITGMGFLPASDRTKGVVHLITGGADKQLLRHDVPLQGGAVSSGLQSLVNGIGSFLAAIVNLALSSFMGMVLLFVALLFTHANNGLLLAGPTSGIDDLVELRFDSVDVQLTLALTLGAIVVTWVSFVTNTVANSLFWNGVLCVASTALSFFVAVSPELALQWKTGDAPFDELLDYKISIILGACSIVFFFLHSLLAKLR